MNCLHRTLLRIQSGARKTIRTINRSTALLPLSRVFILFAIFLESSISYSQDIGIALNDPELAQVRREQNSLALESGVVIRKRDFGNRSSSVMEGVPFEFERLVVQKPDDLVSIIDRVYPYYGFTGTESLKHENTVNWAGETGYVFREYINGYVTPYLITIWVDEELNYITRFIGNLVIDRSFPRVPSQSRAQSMSVATDAIQSLREFSGVNRKQNGIQTAEVAYLPWGGDWSLVPVWHVKIEVDSSTPNSKFQELVIDPQGYVTSLIKFDYMSLVRVCAGSSQENYYCGPAKHTSTINVIDSVGNCLLSPPDCSDYEPAVQIVNEVQEMWEDVISVTGPITSCCSAGGTNSSNGSTIDLNMGTATPSGYAGLFAYPQAPSTSTYAAISLPVEHANNRFVIAHELGHMAHRYASMSTHSLESPTFPLSKVREQAAVREFFADVTGILFQNYNGPNADPKFDTTANWQTSAGVDWSDDFDIDDISAGLTAYQNAAVGGHAMYEAIQNGINPEDLADIFYHALVILDDDDSDDFISFYEFREAMVSAAVSLGSTQIAVLQDAWAEVGVGSDSANTPPISSDPGAPSTPSITNVSFEFCDANGSNYDFTISTVSGVNYYDVYAKDATTVFGWFYVGAWPYSPIPVFTNYDADWKVAACNTSGCSAASEPERTDEICF